MNHKLIAAAALGLSLSSSAVLAADPVEESAITSSAELGMLFKTGNTQSIDVKGGYDFKYEKDLWRSTLAFDILVKKSDQEQEDGTEDFETTNRVWSIVSKTNYILNKSNKSYVYSDISYEDNSITGNFDNQSSFSVGLGREWYKNETTSFFADIGPGYKRDVIRETSEIDTAFIIQAQALYIKQINEHVEFKQSASAKYAPTSGKNSVFNAESSLTTKLIETLQLKISIKLDYNTEVDDDIKKLDTQTAITLVYSF